MAIYKEIIKDNGISANYHRISSVAINHDLDSCIIKLDSYRTEKYRDKDKQRQEIVSSINNLARMTCETNSKDLITVLNSKIETIRENNKELLKENYIIYSNNYTIDYIPEDLTTRGFYNELKKIDIFADAKDI